MARKIQATVGVYPTEEEATVAAETRLNELLEEGHRVIRTDITKTDAGYSAWVTYEELTPEEMAAEEAAAAAAVSRGARGKGLLVALGVLGIGLGIGGVVFAIVRRNG